MLFELLIGIRYNGSWSGVLGRRQEFAGVGKSIGDHRSDAVVNTTSGKMNVILESAAKSVSWMTIAAWIQRLVLATNDGFGVIAG